MTHEPTPMEELEKNYEIFWFKNIDGYTMFGAVHNSFMEKYDRNLTTE